MRDEGRRQWSALELLAAGQVAVVIVVLGVAWWPDRSDTQSPLGFTEGLGVAGTAIVITLPFLGLLAAALLATNRTVRAILGVVMAILSAMATFLAVAIAALTRLDDGGHEA